MANGHGGYRKPTNPAPVSGPGKYSRRTDGAQPKMSLPNAQYGEGKSFEQIQAGATMAQEPSVSAPKPVTLADATSGLTGLSEPSQWATTPVTDGASSGPGAGMDALGIEDPNKQDAAYFAKYLPTLMKQAESPGAPPGYKAWVRTIIANL